jgi:uncharacterized membrane protein
MNSFRRFVALLALVLIVGFAPTAAHEQNKHQQAPPAVHATETTSNGAQAPAGALQNGHMVEMMQEAGDRTSMSTGERLIDWLGRLHPFIVHFPLAFIPAALITAVLGRRRSGFAKPVQFLVIAGGIIAPLATLLGWFDGGLTFADTDPLLRVHRWLGTGIGIGALGLAIWAWKRPESDRSVGMIAGLAVLTAGLMVQGWFGGAMVHGIDHMNW